MLETISIKDMTFEQKKRLLNELGYSTDGKYVLDDQGKFVIDEYADIRVTVNNMLILPGSIKILDNNPLSIASYMRDYPDVFS